MCIVSATRISRSIAFILLTCWHVSLKACPDPEAPLHEYTEMVERMNTYREGSVLCVTSKRYCPDCREGYVHECGPTGSWKPVRRCEGVEIKRAQARINKQLMASSAASSSKEELLREAQSQAQGIREERASGGGGSANRLRDGLSRDQKTPGSCSRDNLSVIQAARSRAIRRSPQVDYVALANANGATEVGKLARSQAEEYRSASYSVCASAGRDSEECLVVMDSIELNAHMAESMHCLASQGY